MYYGGLGRARPHELRTAAVHGQQPRHRPVMCVDPTDATESRLSAMAEEQSVQAVCLERRFNGEEQVCGDDLVFPGTTATPDHLLTRLSPALTFVGAFQAVG